jgi:hypothetical protein
MSTLGNEALQPHLLRTRRIGARDADRVKAKSARGLDECGLDAGRIF